MLTLCSLVLVATPSPEEKLSIYAPQASSSVTVLEREGRQYVSLIDVLEPLGNVEAKADGGRWSIRFTPSGGKPVDGQFTFGMTAAKVRGKSLELAARFLIENGRGLVPLHSLPAVLAHFLPGQVEFHEAVRRLFLGGAAVRFSAELKKAPARLVLSFSSPVNPFVATEPGKLRMVFTREPLLAPTRPTQTVDDRTITGLSFAESSGAAELTISSNAPLLASFSNGRRTITLTPAPQPAQAAAPAALPAATGPSVAAATPQRRVLVILDPAHGGSDSGAALADIAEKDFNLNLARHLRAELEARDIHTVLLRDDDAALTFDQRALFTNGVRPALYLAVHAASAGTGVRVYTSELPADAARAGFFVPWAAAQSRYLAASTSIASALTGELGRRKIAVYGLSAPLRPLNNVATAAIAIEVAPPEDSDQGLSSQAYQQSICNALADALAALRARLEQAVR